MKKKLAIIFTSLLSLVYATSCKEDRFKDFVDYVAQTKLTQEYEGKEFFSDGIEVVTLNSCVDGDTAHFNLQNGRLLKVRFLGVDTPESTGAIEPYGKKAADYTCKILTEASENEKIIVIQSEGAIPEADSTGERYLGWVWADGQLINLGLVQNGYSVSKGTVETQYEDVFYNADRQASKYKLNIWSGEADDSFNYGDYILTDLKEIKENREKWMGQRVIFNGVVTRRNAQNCYIQQEFMNDDGSVSTYGMYIFTGYNDYVKDLFIPGNYIKFSGVVTEYNGNIQITDIKYNPLFPGEHDLEVIETGRPITTKVMTIPEIKETKYTNILVRLENVTFVEQGSYINENGMSINVQDANGNTIIIRAGKGLYFTDENGNQVTDVNYFKDKGKMTFTGNINCYEGVNQVDLSSMDDVVYENTAN